MLVLLPNPVSLEASNQEAAVDDKEEKSLVEKVVDKINDAVENIANTASAAAAYAMESSAEKMAGKPNEQTDKAAAMPDPAGRITPAYDLPAADSGLALERQQYMEDVVATAAAPNKKRAVRAKLSPLPNKAPGKAAKTTKPANKTARKSVKQAPKKSAAKKSAKKSSRKSKKNVGNKAANKNVRKSAAKTNKKKAKKSKR
jgi:hypothetical protein